MNALRLIGDSDFRQMGINWLKTPIQWEKDANGNRRTWKDDDMTKEQKTMTGLKCCWALFSGVEGEPMCSRCPYFDPDFEDNDNNMTCIAELMEDAMDTIKTAKN